MTLEPRNIEYVQINMLTRSPVTINRSKAPPPRMTVTISYRDWNENSNCVVVQNLEVRNSLAGALSLMENGQTFADHKVQCQKKHTYNHSAYISAVVDEGRQEHNIIEDSVLRQEQVEGKVSDKLKRHKIHPQTCESDKTKDLGRFRYHAVTIHIQIVLDCKRRVDGGSDEHEAAQPFMEKHCFIQGQSTES